MFFLSFLDVVVDVYQLGQHISKGRVDEASDLAKKLSGQHVQLEAKPGGDKREEPIQYAKT
jgi:hypothetical protein